MSGDQGFEKFKSRFAAFCGRFVHFCCLIKHDFFFSSILIRKFVEGQKSDHFCVFAFIIKRSLKFLWDEYVQLYQDVSYEG